MDVADQRSLRYHEAVFAKLQTAPELMVRVRAKLVQWSLSESRAQHYWSEYFMRCIAHDFAGLQRALLAADDSGQALRSGSPFGTLLSAQERKAIFYSVKRSA